MKSNGKGRGIVPTVKKGRVGVIRLARKEEGCVSEAEEGRKGWREKWRNDDVVFIRKSGRSRAPPYTALALSN